MFTSTSLQIWYLIMIVLGCLSSNIKEIQHVTAQAGSQEQQQKKHRLSAATVEAI